jgi:hypothetical protein
MNGKAGRETRKRLEHALARLHADPRQRERRIGERRRAALVLLPMHEERRSYADRRRLDRRSA